MTSNINWKQIDIKDLAGLVSKTLSKDGIESILVGGACVAIYSSNRYMSYDLDYIIYEDKDRVKKSLKKLGFSEEDKYFRHPECPFFIELVSPPIAVGKEAVLEFEDLPTAFGSLKLLRDIDCVKDRLASYYHWGDKQSLDQALEVCIDRSIDFEELRRWSQEEGFEQKFNLFFNEFKKKK